jgi:hypothetical protein
MGISKAFLPYIVSGIRSGSMIGPVAVIGDQDIRVSIADLKLSRTRKFFLIYYLLSLLQFSQNAYLRKREFFRELGLVDVDFIDLYGDDILKIDLSKKVPNSYLNRYESIIDIGTTEHIINPFQALENYSAMLKTHGVVFHFVPVKIRPNHGYYSISPQLLFDFYGKLNNFEIVQAEIVTNFFGYDGWSFPTLAFSYDVNEDLTHRRNLTLWVWSLRTIRRILVFFSSSTYISITARKGSAGEMISTLVQEQFKKI